MQSSCHVVGRLVCKVVHSQPSADASRPRAPDVRPAPRVTSGTTGPRMPLGQAGSRAARRSSGRQRRPRLAGRTPSSAPRSPERGPPRAAPCARVRLRFGTGACQRCTRWAPGACSAPCFSSGGKSASRQVRPPARVCSAEPGGCCLASFVNLLA